MMMMMLIRRMMLGPMYRGGGEGGIMVFLG